MIGEDGQRVYTAPPGKEKALPGNIPLFSGYVANELGHGELADLHALSAFLDASPVGSVADHFFPRQGVKANELAAHIADVYQKAGLSSLHVEPVGEVLLDERSVSNSIGHYTKNTKTTPEHKQRVTDAFALVPAVLQKGALVEYGQQMDNKNLHSYIYLAPVQIGKEKCVMAVRIRSAQGQQARFYLHGVTKIDTLKEKSRGCRIQGSGLDTGTPSGADPRDVFRIAKKAYAVKQNIHAAHAAARSTGSPGSAGNLLAELTMREYLRPLAATLKEAKERGESYADIKKRLTAPLTNAAALAHGLAAAFNTGHTLPQDESVAAANPYGCNQYQHAPGCEHEEESAHSCAEKLAGITPIEISYEPEKKTGAEWVKDAQAYFMEHFAGRSFAIGNTGHTLHVGSSKSRAKLAASGVNTQKRNAAFRKLEEVIERAEHLGSEEAKAKEGQGHHKAAILAKTATFEKYGALATINGEKGLIWFNAQTKEKGAKDVFFYEFGVSPLK